MKGFYSNVVSLVYIIFFVMCFQNTYSQRQHQTSIASVKPISASTHFQIKPFERKAFIENRGQLNSILPQDKKGFSYCIDNNGNQIFFHNNSLTYRFQKLTHRKEKVIDLFKTEAKREELEHTIEKEEQLITVEWLNSNPNATIEVVKKTSGIYSYLLKDNNDKTYTETCNGYEKLIYKNLYEGIDVEYFFHPLEGIKYNIICKADADLTQLKLKYTGQKNIKLVNGEIKIKTISGDIIEKAPLSFLSSNQTQHINSSYKLENNILSFNVANLTNEAITIDPWVIAPGFGGTPIVFDNGVDAAGNIYIYGGVAGSYYVEKYSPTGVIIWTFAASSVVDVAYYGDMLVDGSGDFYLSEGYRVSGARTHKFTTTSAFIWTSTTPGADFREQWRLGLDCKTGRVIVIGGGTTYTMSMAEINVLTGVLSNIQGLNGNDLLGLVVDGAGRSCVLSVNDALIFTDANNNNIGSVASGHGYTYAIPHGYNVNGIGHNAMALGGSNFLFTSNGSVLKKWDRSLSSQVGSVVIPGGTAQQASGIYVDGCNNIFVGSNAGVYRFDFNLVQQEFIATSAAVYDIAIAPNGDIIASGNGFTTNLTFNTPPCIFQVAPVVVNSCGGGATGSIKLNLTGGVPTYSYTWSGNGIVASTDSVGGLAAGTYTCIYSDSPCINPRIDTTIITILAIISPTANFVFTPVCLPSATNFTNTTTPIASLGVTIWAWDFDNNGTTDNTTQNPATTFTTAGIHNVELKATNNGCKDSVVIAVIINRNPTAAFVSLNACPNSNVVLNNTSNIPLPDNISTYAWNFGTGSAPTSSSTVQNPPLLTYSSSGIKTITLTITANTTCTASITQTVEVYPQPVANFSTTSVCQSTATAYTDLSTTSVGTINAWAWDFTNNASVDNATVAPTNVFATSGTFSTSLIVTTSNSCKDTIVLPINVWGHTIPDFIPTTVCFGTATNFSNTTNTITNANVGSGTTYVWNFADGSATTNLNSPFHTYTLGGNANAVYNVTLTATSINNCVDNVVKVVNVYALPTASFTSDSVCLGSSSNMADASNGNGNSVNSYVWDFSSNGSVDVSGVPNPNFTFPAYGNNNVTYTVSTSPVVGLVCSNTTNTIQVWVHPNPIPDFTFVNNCINAQPNSFNGSPSTIAIGSNATYFWAYGDGAVSTPTLASTSTHIYLAAGVYNATLIVTSNKGCQTAISKQVEVYQKPLMNIASSSACNQSAMSFTAVSMPNSGTVANWFWDFNTTISTIEAVGQTTGFTFPVPGAHTVALISVTSISTGACRDTTIKQIYVNYVPVPLFNVDKQNGCPIHCVTFTDATLPIASPSQITQWQWTLGDGTIITNATNTNVNHCYINNSSNQSALYDVNLQVTTDSGCVNSINKISYITVYPKPIANYTVNPNPGNVVTPLVYFTNQSQDYTKWWWIFGDNSPIDSLRVSPEHFYSDITAATYYSLLIVANQYGCLDTAYVPVEIGPEFTFYIPNAFTPSNDDGINDYFTGTGIGITEYEMWIFDRWGAMIFYTDDIQKGWNGKVQGESGEVKQDVYTWKVDLKNVLNKKHSYIGHVTLLK